MYDNIDENDENLVEGQFEDLARFRNWQKANEENCMFLFLDAEGTTADEVAPIVYALGKETKKAVIYLLRIMTYYPETVNGHRVNVEIPITVVIVGHRSIGTLVRSMPYKEKREGLLKGPIRRFFVPGDVFPKPPPRSNKSGGFSAIQETIPAIPICSDDELMAFLDCQKASTEIKLLTTLYNFFPWGRDAIEDKVYVLEFDAAMETLGLDVDTSPMDPGQPKEDRFKTITALMLLGPGYSNAKTLGDQVHKRMQSAAQQIDQHCPPKAMMQPIIDGMKFKVEERTSIMDEMLGKCIAVNKDGEYDETLKDDQTMDLQPWVRRQLITSWSAAMMKQMKLVYEYSHAKTLKFAMDVATLLEDIMMSMGDVWKKEVMHVLDLKQRLQFQPFSGLSASLEEPRQVSNYPRVAYMGLEYHKKLLGNDEQKTLFGAYNIVGIVNKIDKEQDKATCDVLVNTIPTTNVISLASVISVQGLAAARKIMDSEDADTKAAVLRKLIDEKSNCAWRWFWEGETRKKEVNRIYAAVNTIVVTAIDSKIRDLKEMANNEDDRKKRKVLMSAINKKSIAWNTILAGGQSIKDRVDAPQDQSMMDTYLTITKKLDDLLDAVNRFEYSNLTEDQDSDTSVEEDK